MPLTPGQKLAAYEIVSALGAGGMGELYRARDTRLGREVALKILPPDVTNEPGRLERFDREARAIAALNHPHIVTIFSTEDADGIRFLTMELVDGHTLSELVVPSGMATTRFLDIAIPLADALVAAHQKQITHRDLKPGNVMISHDGRVKVLDFGLARVGGRRLRRTQPGRTAAPITHLGMIVGTMPYMSPEQVEGRTIDARSDLFFAWGDLLRVAQRQAAVRWRIVSGIDVRDPARHSPSRHRHTRRPARRARTAGRPPHREAAGGSRADGSGCVQRAETRSTNVRQQFDEGSPYDWALRPGEFVDRGAAVHGTRRQSRRRGDGGRAH